MPDWRIIEALMPGPPAGSPADIVKQRSALNFEFAPSSTSVEVGERMQLPPNVSERDLPAIGALFRLLQAQKPPPVREFGQAVHYGPLSIDAGLPDLQYGPPPQPPTPWWKEKRQVPPWGWE